MHGNGERGERREERSVKQGEKCMCVGRRGGAELGRKGGRNEG